MILIADAGSTKTDWIIFNEQGIVFKEKTSGLNPAITDKTELKKKIEESNNLIINRNRILEVYFYGAGCGTEKPKNAMANVLSSIFNEANIHVHEDLLAAVFATTGNKKGIVCILGTGSNSCFFDGTNIITPTISLGYTIMDEASGNYFGKQLLRDYFYKQMPYNISKAFEDQFNLDADEIKYNLYKKPNPNTYLASLSTILLQFKEEEYTQQLIKTGFDVFLKYKVLNFENARNTPIHFIGSIAYFFKDILLEVAKEHNLQIKTVIQSPINNLLNYHQALINKR